MHFFVKDPLKFIEKNREIIFFWIQEGLLLSADGRSVYTLLNVTQKQLDRYYQLENAQADMPFDDPFPDSLDTLDAKRMLRYIEMIYKARCTTAACTTPEMEALGWLKEAIAMKWQYIHGHETSEHYCKLPEITTASTTQPAPTLVIDPLIYIQKMRELGRKPTREDFQN